jgi:hypothetical protein
VSCHLSGTSCPSRMVANREVSCASGLDCRIIANEYFQRHLFWKRALPCSLQLTSTGGTSDKTSRRVSEKGSGTAHCPPTPRLPTGRLRFDYSS